jgi:hypothetical protein
MASRWVPSLVALEITAYQINLRRSPLAVIIDRFAGDRQLFWVYGR